MTPPKVPTLLNLPRELRDKVLVLLIQNHTTPPTEVSEEEERTNLRDFHPEHWGSDYGVMHVESLNRAEFIPTLLVNQQLHRETLETIKRLPNNHALHVMLVDEECLWPTWISAPSLNPNIENLHVSIISVGLRDVPWMGWTNYRGYPSDMIWYFYHLLERVLKVGPRVGWGFKKSREIIIKSLDIEILWPDVPREKIALENLYPNGKAYSPATHLYIHPLTLANCLWGYINDMLGMVDSASFFGFLVYERVGTIRILLDGKVLYEVDLGERLDKCQFDNAFSYKPVEERLPYFLRWKADTHEKRRFLGLPITPGDWD